MTTNLISQILTVSGEDTFKFLQGQITADLSILESSPAQSQKLLSAYCNRQGRVISVFYILKNTNDSFCLIFLGDTANLFLSHIKKYSIFSKVQFSKVLTLNEVSLNEQVPLEACYYLDNKIPFINQQTTEKYIPNELNLIEHDAVSFKKGCFLGQEIIARVYYKGKAKKSLAVVSYKDDDNALKNLTNDVLLNDKDNKRALVVIKQNKL